MNAHNSIVHDTQKVETTQMSTVGQMGNKMCYPHAIEYCPPVKRNEAQTPALAKMDLENVMLGESSQAQNSTHCVIPLIPNVHSRQISRDRKEIHVV